MPDMKPTSLTAAVAPHTGKIIKNGLRGFERGENLLQNGILHVYFYCEARSMNAKALLL